VILYKRIVQKIIPIHTVGISLDFMNTIRNVVKIEFSIFKRDTGSIAIPLRKSFFALVIQNRL